MRILMIEGSCLYELVYCWKEHRSRTPPFCTLSNWCIQCSFFFFSGTEWVWHNGAIVCSCLLCQPTANIFWSFVAIWGVQFILFTSQIPQTTDFSTQLCCNGFGCPKALLLCEQTMWDDNNLLNNSIHCVAAACSGVQFKLIRSVRVCDRPLNVTRVKQIHNLQQFSSTRAAMLVDGLVP